MNKAERSGKDMRPPTAADIPHTATEGERNMSQGSKRTILAAVAFAAVLVTTLASTTTARAAGEGQPYDWQRFYYYPYVYYPHNFQGVHQYDNLYYRYPPERQIPVYRADWYNFYPTAKPYHRGHHFILDVF